MLKEHKPTLGIGGFEKKIKIFIDNGILEYILNFICNKINDFFDNYLNNIDLIEKILSSHLLKGGATSPTNSPKINKKYIPYRDSEIVDKFSEIDRNMRYYITKIDKDFIQNQKIIILFSKFFNYLKDSLLDIFQTKTTLFKVKKKKRKEENAPAAAPAAAYFNGNIEFNDERIKLERLLSNARIKKSEKIIISKILELGEYINELNSILDGNNINSISDSISKNLENIISLRDIINKKAKNTTKYSNPYNLIPIKANDVRLEEYIKKLNLNENENIDILQKILSLIDIIILDGQKKYIIDSIKSKINKYLDSGGLDIKKLKNLYELYHEHINTFDNKFNNNIIDKLVKYIDKLNLNENIDILQKVLSLIDIIVSPNKNEIIDPIKSKINNYLDSGGLDIKKLKNLYELYHEHINTFDNKFNNNIIDKLVKYIDKLNLNENIDILQKVLSLIDIIVSPNKNKIINLIKSKINNYLDSGSLDIKKIKNLYKLYHKHSNTFDEKLHFNIINKVVKYINLINSLEVINNNYDDISYFIQKIKFLGKKTLLKKKNKKIFESFESLKIKILKFIEEESSIKIILNLIKKIISDKKSYDEDFIKKLKEIIIPKINRVTNANNLGNIETDNENINKKIKNRLTVYSFAKKHIKMTLNKKKIQQKKKLITESKKDSKNFDDKWNQILEESNIVKMNSEPNFVELLDFFKKNEILENVFRDVYSGTAFLHDYLLYKECKSTSTSNRLANSSSTNASTSNRSVNGSSNSKYTIYNKMKKSRVPEGSIRQKMLMDGIAINNIDKYFGEQDTKSESPPSGSRPAPSGSPPATAKVSAAAAAAARRSEGTPAAAAAAAARRSARMPVAAPSPSGSPAEGQSEVPNKSSLFNELIRRKPLSRSSGSPPEGPSAAATTAPLTRANQITINIEKHAKRMTNGRLRNKGTLSRTGHKSHVSAAKGRKGHTGNPIARDTSHTPFGGNKKKPKRKTKNNKSIKKSIKRPIKRKTKNKKSIKKSIKRPIKRKTKNKKSIKRKNK